MGTLKIALRTLLQTPVVTGVAVLSLALGIGANAAIYSLFDQMLMQALPVEEPGELVNIANPGPKSGWTSCGQAGGCDEIFSYPMFKDLESAETGFAGIAAHVLFGANLASDGRTVSGQGMMVSGGYFPLLGVQPALGRLIDPEDDAGFGESFVAVLSHDYWQNRLGGEAGVLNRSIVINGQSFTVVGVAAEGFRGTTLGTQPDVFVPITMRAALVPGWDAFERRNAYWAYLFARTAPGVDPERAGDELNQVYRGVINDVEAELQNMSPATLERFRARELVFSDGYRGQSSIHEDVATPLSLLLAITGTVLLIACANVANLLLARGAQRGQEMAVRGALGASRRHLLRQLLTESALLALAGGAASLLIAVWTLRGLSLTVDADTMAALSFGLSPQIVGFTAALSLLTGFVFGMYPALHATRSDLAAVLRSNTGQPSGSRDAARFRNTMVIVQLALSTALLVAAGLFVRSLVNVTRVDLGIDSQAIVQFGISPELNGYTPDESQELFRQVEESLDTLPGASAVTASLVAIFTGSNWGQSFSVEGFEGGPDIDSNARLNYVGPGYFSALGVPLLAGREFTTSDTLDTPRVAVINVAFAEKFGLDPRRAVGKRLSDNGAGVEELDVEIIGVIENAKYAEVKQTVPPLYYAPYRQNDSLGDMTFYVRADGDPDQILRAVPSVIERLDPNLPVENLKTLETQIKENIVLDRVISMLSSGFASLATILAAVGLYGVLAFTVSQRTREIGVRMALGANPWTVRGLVLGQLGKMTVIGVVLGMAGAYALGQAAESLLFELEGTDPLTITLSVAGLFTVALLAGYLPARRASRVDPMRALRNE
ncbi:MAG: FtsX-like permease family protein [Acidobacteria bacterium]|nr:FtsX-like permease family protein [Acidobacteriota bacterium]